MRQISRDQIRRLRTLTQAQAAVGWAIILFLVALLGTIYLRQIGERATIGRDVRNLQDELANVKARSTMLEREIAEAQELERLLDEASRLGFVPAAGEEIEYLVIPDYPTEEGENPLTAPEIAAPTPAPEPLPTMRAAIWQYLRTQFNDFIRGEAHEQ